jgi:protein disulfide-isomerase A1
MDATANDVPPSAGFKIQGFPTIKFKPAGSTVFSDYEGARELVDFVNFLEKNAKNDITLPKNESAEKVEQIVLEKKEEEVKEHDELVRLSFSCLEVKRADGFLTSKK